MFILNSNLKVINNIFGVKEAKLIKTFNNLKYGRLGFFILLIASKLKKQKNRMELNNKYKTGKVKTRDLGIGGIYKGVILNQKRKTIRFDGSQLKFDKNRVVIYQRLKDVPLNKRLRCRVPWELHLQNSMLRKKLKIKFLRLRAISIGFI